jgi:hypothetical protein
MTFPNEYDEREQLSTRAPLVSIASISMKLTFIITKDLSAI